jgi:hypothetical protein
MKVPRGRIDPTRLTKRTRSVLRAVQRSPERFRPEPVRYAA